MGFIQKDRTSVRFWHVDIAISSCDSLPTYILLDEEVYFKVNFNYSLGMYEV